MPVVTAFYEEQTSAVTYVVADDEAKVCAVIDPVLDYRLVRGCIETTAADHVIKFIKERGYTVGWILETHTHVDHITAVQYLKEKLGGKVAIGERVKEVIAHWAPIFNDKDVPLDGSYFDHLLKDGEVIFIGSIPVSVLATPGHSPCSVTYSMDNTLFVGDLLLMPHYGTGRTDFPGGSAEDQYDSIMRLYRMPNKTRVYIGHDYPLNDNPPRWESTIGVHKKKNNILPEGTVKDVYVQERNARSQSRKTPKLIIPSMQLNIRAGKLPPAAANGTQYLVVPLNKIT